MVAKYTFQNYVYKMAPILSRPNLLKLYSTVESGKTELETFHSTPHEANIFIHHQPWEANIFVGKQSSSPTVYLLELVNL